MSPPARQLHAAVIGGGGFIGRRLVAALRQAGLSVRGIGLTAPAPEGGPEWVSCDVRDREGVARAVTGCELVYNLAAAHGLNALAPEVYHQINIDGARNLVRALEASGIPRLVFTSTADVYGRGASFDEASAPEPLGDYGRTKLAAEGIYRAWAASDATRSLTIVRPTVVFGPGGEGTVGQFLRHVTGPDFTHFGEARTRRSLAFVDNLAAFLAFLHQSPAGTSLYNYADLPDLEIAEIVAIVRRAVDLPPAPRRSLAGAYAATLGAALRARIAGRPGPPSRTLYTMRRQLGLERRLDASRAHATGFRQPVALPDALDRTARADLRWIALLSRARA